MSERNPHEELADITATLRRYLERERSAGTGELLNQSAAVARLDARFTARIEARAAAAPAVATIAATAPRPAPATDSSSLFAAPVAAAAVADAPVAATPTFQLPPVHPELHSIDVTERMAYHAAALPVLDEIAATARACRKCGLCETRTNAVPGVGSARSGIVFVGEAPGADEDARGEPFVGRAGQLLTQIIKGMDDKQLIPGVPLDRDSVYICNVLKCRPPENRNPLPNEIEMCSPYLRRQLEVLKPRVICCLGKFAAELLVGVKGTIAGLRGKVYRYQGAKLIVTYHPAACLRNPNYKRPVWEDMQLLAREYLAQGVR